MCGQFSQISKVVLITALLIELVLAVLPVVLHASVMVRAFTCDTENRLKYAFPISQRTA